MYHPFADLIGLTVDFPVKEYSHCSIEVTEKLLNPHKVVHGAVLYALADTGMGAAVYPHLKPDELCATIEIKITYFKPVFDGEIICITKIINKGKTIVNLEAEIFNKERLVAKANGNFSIFKKRKLS